MNVLTQDLTPGLNSIIRKNLNVEQVISFLQKELTVLEAIYIYGSATTEDFTKRSDLDIALKVLQPLDNYRRWRIQEKLAALVNRNIDLLDLDRASLVMKFEVVSKGIRMYCEDVNETDLYETTIYSRYLDFNEIRKPIIEAILERGTVYDPR